MHDIEPNSVLSLLALVGFAIGGVYSIARAVRSFYRFVKRLELIHHTILLELSPNGGSSMKDHIDNLDHRLSNIENALGVNRPETGYVDPPVSGSSPVVT